MVAAGQYLTRGIDSIIALVAALGRTASLRVHASKVWETLEIRPEEKQENPWTAEVINTVTLDKVSFKYETQPLPIICQASFQLVRGEVVALQGRSGIGKSTLASVICGLTMPSSGSCTVNGIAVTKPSLKSLRLRTALVSGNDHVFIGTVRENLLVVKPHATQTEVDQCSRLSVLDQVISVLPNGLDTQVGRGGHELSSGERQRLSLARAVLRDAEVVVFDEVTANIDLRTEDVLFDRLMPWLRARIVLIITHRPQTLDRADRVVCLDSGVIVQIR